jgi:DNA-binding LacI/PurR family transcriptional regulator
MLRNITIQEVAREAGVCIGTVSRVINGKDRVRPETRERIQEIIERLDYRPSAMGRALVTRRSQNIMALTHNIADPFCVALVKRFGNLCRQNGYKLLVGDSDYDLQIEAECLGMMRDGSVDGLIITPLSGRRNLPLFSSLAASGFPLVSVSMELPGCSVPCVKFDDRKAGRLATDYLLDKGHRRIAFVDWHTEFQTVRDRYQGYLESHAERNLKALSAHHLKLPLSLGETNEKLRAVLSLKTPPTALIAVNEMVALACFNALAQLNLRVPEDVAIIAFGDEFPEGGLPKPMTVVALPEAPLVELAWERLHERLLTGKKAPSVASVDLVAPELIVRQSA